MSNEAKYAAYARAVGCPRDQIENFSRYGCILQPRQLAMAAAARECDHQNGPTEIGVGGARGGGKSHWLTAQIGLDDCQRLPKCKALIMRKVGKSNAENFEDLRMRLFGHVKHHWKPSNGILTFSNGSRIILGHYQQEKDIDKYLGLEYDVIGIEEATTLTSRKYKDIKTCNRTSKSGWRPRIYNNTNPGNVGHAWYKAQFITPLRLKQEVGTRFIPSTVDDNRFVNDTYLATLDSLTGWQYRAWRLGDWDIAAGQYYTTFRRELDGKPWHVLPEVDPRIIKTWYGGLDYGFTHYTTCYLVGEDGDGNTYIMDEHAERQKLVPDHAEGIREMVGRYHKSAPAKIRNQPVEQVPLTLDDLEYIAAGTDCWGKERDGKTVAKDYEECGIRLTPANTDRIQGATYILKLLGDPDKPPEKRQQPRLFIHQRCQRLIDCLPMLEHDPNRPEDVLKVDADEDGIGGDDPYDGVRYALNSRANKLTVKKLKGL